MCLIFSTIFVAINYIQVFKLFGLRVAEGTVRCGMLFYNMLREHTNESSWFENEKDEKDRLKFQTFLNEACVKVTLDYQATRTLRLLCVVISLQYGYYKIIHQKLLGEGCIVSLDWKHKDLTM